jgi:DNA repair protein RecO (recombination protein O)
LVVTIYTELFGIQSYLVNGVRTERKTASKANIYQASTILDLIVYHHPNKNLQRIKEARIQHMNQQAHHSFIKNTIAIFIAELIYKTIIEPETNAVLYQYFEDSFIYIDHENEFKLANFPIEFTFDLASHLGFAVQNEYSSERNHFDLLNGVYCSHQSLTSTYFMDGEMAQLISEISNHKSISHILNQQKRRDLLQAALQYLKLHIPHLGELRSVNVLHEIMN